MTGKRKSAAALSNSDADLLDDIERVLFKAKDAQRPFIELLLRMAFVEAFRALGRHEQNKRDDALSITRGRLN